MSKIKESDRLEKIKKRVEFIQDEYGNSVREIDTDHHYYRGRQLSNIEEKEIKDAKKIYVKYNHIKAQVNHTRGRQSENRYYFKVIPADNVTGETPVTYDGRMVTVEELAKILTAELEEAENKNDGEYQLSDCFLEGIIGGRSFVEAFIEEDESVFPRKRQVVFEHRTYKQCFPDPQHVKYDLSDCEDFVKFVEIQKDEMISRFPDKEAEIKQFTREDNKLVSRNNDDNELTYIDKSNKLSFSEKDKRETDDLILTEYYDFDYNDRYLLVFPDSSVAPREFKNKKEADNVKKLLEIRQAQGSDIKWQMIRLRSKEWYVNFLSNGKMLERKKTNITRLNFAQYAPDRIKSIEEIALRDIGIVRDLRDPQRVYNKSKSKLMEHLNSSINSGVAAEDGALQNPEEWEDFGSSNGFVGIINKGYWGKWSKIEPSRLSEGHAYIAKDTAEEMRYINNYNLQQLGYKEGNESGRAIALRQRQGNTGTNYYYDNFRRTKHVLCKIMLELICYLKGCDYKSLQVVIDDAAESPTARYANWLESKEMLADGVLETPYGDLMIASMNVNNREEWNARWEKVVNLQAREAGIAEAEKKIEAQQLALQDAAKQLTGQEGAQQ